MQLLIGLGVPADIICSFLMEGEGGDLGLLRGSTVPEDIDCAHNLGWNLQKKQGNAQQHRNTQHATHMMMLVEPTKGGFI